MQLAGAVSVLPLSGSEPQRRATLDGATAKLDVEPVTLHLKPFM